jgi:hypothetical protein
MNNGDHPFTKNRSEAAEGPGGKEMVEQEDMSSNKRNKTQQSRMVAGVSVRISNDGAGDYDELLREAIRVALRIDTNPACDDFPELCVRIRERRLHP